MQDVITENTLSIGNCLFLVTSAAFIMTSVCVYYKGIHKLMPTLDKSTSTEATVTAEKSV